MTDKLPFDIPGIAGFGRKKKPERSRYGGLNRRVLASTIDSTILLVVMPLLNRLVPVDTDALHKLQSDLAAGGDTQTAGLRLLTDPAYLEFTTSVINNFLAQIAVLCVFSAVCWHYWSTTPGKMLLGLKIADAETEQPISDRQIVLRLFGYVVSGIFFLLGFFWISFDRRRQGWHDKIAGMVVVVVPWRTILSFLTAGRLGSREPSSME